MSEVKSSKKSKSLTIAIASILILAGIFVSWRIWANRKDALAFDYREALVTRGDIQVTILSTGIVQPENRLEIKPPISGRVETVLVKEGQKVKKGQLLAWMSSSERAALLDAARAKGPEELQRWEELYRPTPIMAPISGTIIQRNVESGQTFTNSDAVLVMSDRLTIKAQVDETDIAQIKTSQKANIILDAYPNQVIPGNVDQIAYDAKTVNNVTTYLVDVLPESTPSSMRSGMTANVTFFVAAKQEALLVPTESLRTLNGKFSILVKSEGRAKPIEKEIEIGLSDGKKTEIIGGLQENEKILIAELKSNQPYRSKSGSNPFAPMGRAPARNKGR
jgi:macrolide-specific efflux system membrane fusion protein